MIKAAFFDVDGTLLSFETHLMPASTKAALIELRRRGVKCFVATGRLKKQLPPCVRDGFEGFDRFDAYVTLSGSYCYGADDQPFFEVPIDAVDAAHVVEQVKQGLYEVIVMDAEHDFVSAKSPEILEVERLANLSYDVGDVEYALTHDVFQFCGFVPPEREHIITDGHPGLMTTRWTDLFCDVVPARSGKPEGIRATLERFGIGVDEAIAFGDGGNDVTMLQTCGIGVAMGNGTPECRAAADYVTDDVDHDGIANALRHFGLM